MRRVTAIVAVVLFAAPTGSPARLSADEAKPPAPASEPALDLSTPEAAVRSFIQCSNRLSVDGVNCLTEGAVDQDLKDWLEEARKSQDGWLQTTVVSVRPEVNGDTATAAVTLEMKVLTEQHRFDESVTLRKVGTDWKLVPPTEAELGIFFARRQTEAHIFALLMATYSRPKVFLAARKAAHEAALDATCQSNMKQLSTALLLFIQDHDERYALRADRWKAALMPYAKGEVVFHCPNDPGGPVAYSFNVQLQGKSLGAIRKPEQTITLYEGSKGVLNFRHQGRAFVALANSAVRKVTPAEARALRWSP